MDKNQPFFDPYNFNMNTMQGAPMQNDMSPALEPMQNIMSPGMYYEQQYMYYKYLTQMLDYKMKLKEYEKMNREMK